MRSLTDFAKALALCWAVVVILACLASLLLGCASTTAVETTVRRADSLADVDRIGDELGARGWHVVEVELVDGGWHYVVVVERRKAAR